MQRFKRTLRLLGLTAMLLLAAAGVGLTGAAPTHQKRERFIDTGPRTEQVDEQATRADTGLAQE
ncbi:hypothetical protein LGH70_16935 [Hymenobacter sp. BT635]|uniref:Secreted protein n=1 Tax=Hymenobacter nitidus TaxID=2880929 RepID=A0ABS8AFR8_9BACT|nr:hypothetical protein [Hymenobacter nitidus]MCB2379285.1 hypothetical protein [Hymenobacter nitidus]